MEILEKSSAENKKMNSVPNPVYQTTQTGLQEIRTLFRKFATALRLGRNKFRRKISI
jgi:hypothetical protein